MAASLRVFDSGLYPSLAFRPDFRRNSGFCRSDSDFTATGRKVFKLRNRSCFTFGFRVRCRLQEGENASSDNKLCFNPFSFIKKSLFGSREDRAKTKLNALKCLLFSSLLFRSFSREPNGEEPPESEFMKELRKRGMTPTSLLEDNKKLEEDDGEFSKMNLLSTDIEKSLSNQRERSMALNSEGLEGLIPRAKLLLTTGGTFFIGFWPLILISVAFFSALYLYFGASFIHDASRTPIAPPPYIDPYALLEDDRMSQTVNHVKL